MKEKIWPVLNGVTVLLFVFVMGLKMGVAGAALGTVIAQAVAKE